MNIYKNVFNKLLTHQRSLKCLQAIKFLYLVKLSVYHVLPKVLLHLSEFWSRYTDHLDIFGTRTDNTSIGQPILGDIRSGQIMVHSWSLDQELMMTGCISVLQKISLELHFLSLSMLKGLVSSPFLCHSKVYFNKFLVIMTNYSIFISKLRITDQWRYWS